MYLRVETRIPTTRVSISVLTIVMGTHRMSERDKDTSKHQRARLCPAHPRGVEGTRKKNIQVMGEHRCACPCPAHPWGVKGTRKMTHRTRTGTGVLAHVLCVHGVSKRQEKDTGHKQAPVCSLMSCGSTGCRRDKKKGTQDTGKHQCARSCPVGLPGVKGTRKKTQDTSEHWCAHSCPMHLPGVEGTIKKTYRT